MKKHRKVIVVGGGPAGSVCATTLRRRGATEVVIVERQRELKDKTCAGGLSPRAITELRRLGLSEPIEREAGQIGGAVLGAPDGHKLRIEVGLMAMVLRRARLDGLLRESAEGLGATVMSDVAVDRLLEEKGAVVGVGAGDLELEADVVVVATGARNKLCWDPRPRQRLDAVLARFEAKVSEPQMMHVYYHRSLTPHYIWLFPEPGGTVNVGLCRFAGSSETSLTTVLEGLVDELFPEIAGAPQVERTRGHPIVYTDRARYLVRKGAVRVGEAAWLTDLFTGEGIWHALISGEQAALAISQGDLDQYQRRSRRLLDPSLAISQRLTRIASTRLWTWMLRSAGFKPFGLMTGRLLGGLGK